MPPSVPITVSELHVLWFRACRQFLVGKGAVTAAEAASGVLGFQAQQEKPALLGLSQRMAGRPNAEAVLEALRSPAKELVWTWGQRDTLHFFDAELDWPNVVFARPEWAEGSRRGGMPPDEVLEVCWQAIKDREGTFTKDAITAVLPEAYVASVAPVAERARMEPLRFAATRIMWKLAQRGDVCLAGKDGAERTYVCRNHWFPALNWAPKTSLEAAASLAKRYLANYGPATPADIAHYFGARVRDVRRWLAEFEGDCVPVTCEGRDGLLLLAGDVDQLLTDPPKPRDWPLRLLPLWDGHLMGHKDKTWLLPDPAENKKVWRAGAYVSATVWSQGRIAATWSHKMKRGQLHVAIQPLKAWQKGDLDKVIPEALAVARHWSLAGAVVKVS